MSGPSAAGKTYYAKKFIEKHPDVKYLCIDDFYEVFNGSKTKHENEFQVWISFFNAIHAAEKNCESVLIDTNSPTRVMRSQFLDWFPSFNKNFLIYIDSTFDSCYKRNKMRERVVPYDELQKMYNQVEIPCVMEDLRWNKIFSYFCTEDNTYVEYETALAGPGYIRFHNYITDCIDFNRCTLILGAKKFNILQIAFNESIIGSIKADKDFNFYDLNIDKNKLSEFIHDSENILYHQKILDAIYSNNSLKKKMKDDFSYPMDERSVRIMLLTQGNTISRGEITI